jgi:hypothetical protein
VARTSRQRLASIVAEIRVAAAYRDDDALHVVL